ncbi:uncharacterized protein LOC100210723 isoform X1 [Hydra vulgaris]|uniref:uncharacterized protein LOC100210723 isoform X1 n=1 Tax=Hydra vulgaris TaxID=6087 RepID=UPI0032EA55DD
MSFISQYTPKWFPSNFFDINNKELKIVVCIGGAILGAKLSLDYAKKISMSGNSNNPLVKTLHNILKPYLNCGLLVRNEFSVLLPWQFCVLSKKSYVIVNYGSYGTGPIKVQNYQTALLRQTECCPDLFYRFTLIEKYEESRVVVANAVGCHPDNLVFVENITEGINVSLRSFLRNFTKSDSILCLRSIGYSAVLKAIDVLAKEYNVKVVNLEIQFPIHSKEDLCAQFEDAILKHPRIKLAIFDHITSASSVVLPIHDLGIICQKYNVISVVDGAHAPGQLYLDVENYNVDIYLGNLHKWYYTPKSCAIMYVKSKYHDQMQPSWVSHHAYMNFHQRFWRQGTKNYTAMLTAGYSVGEYMKNIGGISHLHSYITPLVEWAVQLYIHEWGTEEIQVPPDMKAPYMRTVYLPNVFTEVYGGDSIAADALIKSLIKEERLVIFINPVQGRLSTRVSAQIFSTRAEYTYAAEVIKRKALELTEKLAGQEVVNF